MNRRREASVEYGEKGVEAVVKAIIARAHGLLATFD